MYVRGILKEVMEIARLAKEENLDRLSGLVSEIRHHPIYGPLVEGEK